VLITYERGVEVKTINAPFGSSGRDWITPSVTDLTFLDARAKPTSLREQQPVTPTPR